MLLASELLRTLFAGGVDAVSRLVPDALDPQLVGAVVYAALGLVALAGLYAAVRRLYATDHGFERHELVQVAGVAAALLLVAGYLLHGTADVPVFPGDVVTSLTTGVGVMGVLALGYARAYSVDMRLESPGRDALPLVGAAVLVSAVAGVGQFAVTAALGNPRFGGVVIDVFVPRLSVGLIAWRVAVPGAFTAIGMGLLYNGAVQEALRDEPGAPEAVAAATALVGVLGWSPVANGLATGPTETLAALAATTLLSLIAAFLAARGVRPFARSLGVELTPAVAAAFAVLAVAVPLLGVAVVHRPTTGIAVAGVALTSVAAVAAVGYERSRSAWVPVTAFAAYLIVGDTELLLGLVRLFG